MVAELRCESQVGDEARTSKSDGFVQQQLDRTDADQACAKADHGTDYIFNVDWIVFVGSISASETCCEVCLVQKRCLAYLWVSNASQAEGSDPG